MKPSAATWKPVGEVLPSPSLRQPQNLRTTTDGFAGDSDAKPPQHSAKSAFNFGRLRWLGLVARDAELPGAAHRVAVVLWQLQNDQRSHLVGGMRLHQFYGDDIDVKFESRAGDPWNSWLCLRYSMVDYCSGEEFKIDDKVYLATTRPHFGGLRWWFLCPHLNRRVRKLYLPLGGRHFWSRRAYRLAYASQRETVHDRAMRRARKLYLRLGGDPADDTYPHKPTRMRWITYNRLMDTSTWGKSRVGLIV
jgi:hypothetical protein